MDLGWTGGSVGEIPMNNDLSLANQDGAYFTFETVADTLTFYFMGELRVKSSVFDTEKTFTQSPATIEFGNDIGMAHTVTVTARQGTRIDRYAATYKTDPVIDSDPAAPQMLWSRSFPETASIETGSSVPMTCYVMDATGIQSVSFNGQTLSETTEPALVKLEEGLWYFDYTFTADGVYKVRAMDLSGNSSTASVGVDWFNSVLSVGAVGEAPALQRSDLSFVDANGDPVDPSAAVTSVPWLKSAYALQPNETSSAHLFIDGAFSGTALGKLSGERWQAGWNGCYLVRVDRSDGTWARHVVRLENLDLTPPPAVPKLDGAGTPDSPYLIGSLADWQELASYTNGGNPTSGLYFRQTADLTVTDADLIGTAESPFMGIYEGDGHTLSFQAENAPDGCAPFRIVENAAFHDLRLEGSITTSVPCAAGLCGEVRGSCSIIDCLSAVEIHSEFSGEGMHGGFIALTALDSEVELIGSRFTGGLWGAATTGGASFIGSCGGSASISDSLAQPKAFEWKNASAFVCVAGDTAPELRNCYYLDVPTEEQGREAFAVVPDPDVSLGFGAGKTYEVAALTAHDVGLSFADAYHAGAGETVSLRATYSGSNPVDAESFFLASAGTLTGSAGSYSLTMPHEQVTIRIGSHEWGTPWYEWAEDYSEITAYVACRHNPLHIAQETVRPNFVLTQPSTFEEEGSGYYLAEFKDGRFADQTVEISIPPVACEGGDVCPGLAFTDMPPITSTMHIPIDWAVLNRITTGTTPTTFGTKQSCTRAQFVTFLWRTVGQPEPAQTEHPFKDVRESAYYYKAMLWAVEQGITTGASATTFSPNKPCTRAQVVTFIWRLEGAPEPDLMENPFKDVKETGFYYRAMLWAVGRKITTGTSETTFSPGSDCTRAQCVTFLFREFGQ